MAGPGACLLSEFIGTFLLTFVAGAVALGDTVAEAWGPTVIACTLMVLVYSFASVSGGHFNPAVSLAAGLAKKMQWSQVLAYALVQTAAGISGGLAQLRAFGGRTTSVEPKPGAVWWEAMVLETLYTALLALVVLSVTARRNHPEKNPNQFYGLAIGFVIVAAGAAAGGVSGAALNPALAVGIDFWGHKTPVMYHGIVYALFQLIGAAVASMLFWFTHPEDFMHEAAAKAYQPSVWTQLSGEFIGTFFLVLTLGLCTIGASAATPWAVAAALMSVMYAFGDVSGGHFNPAVTMSAVLCRKIDISMWHGLLYSASQLLAGLLAGILYAGLSKGRTFPLEPKLPYTEWAAYLLEAVFTSLLALTVLSTGYAKGIRTLLRRNYYFGLASGLVRVAGGVASAKVSGASFNPAISFGIGFAHKLNYGNMYYCLSYTLAELIGGAAAVVAFALVHAEAYRPRQKPMRG